MDVCRPHGHIPSLQVLFGDQFWPVCRLPVEDTELPLSLFRAILLTCKVLAATCNYLMEIRFIYFPFSLFLKTTRVPHGGFHANFLP